MKGIQILLLVLVTYCTGVSQQGSAIGLDLSYSGHDGIVTSGRYELPLGQRSLLRFTAGTNFQDRHRLSAGYQFAVVNLSNFRLLAGAEYSYEIDSGTDHILIPESSQQAGSLLFPIEARYRVSDRLWLGLGTTLGDENTTLRSTDHIMKDVKLSASYSF